MNQLENKQYSFLELLEKVGIKIPIIQRDYAQGRVEAKNIREKFIQNLYNILKDEESINLDFVYGTVKDDYLIPLDGQQRLTTLFLLHYYLIDDKDDKRELLKKFTYETRVSSREFCTLLIEKNINKGTELISATIKNQTWFFSAWENDPTISAMLNTLDTTQDIFGDIKISDKKLKNITFSFLNLDDFKLTDELYIKMNARGKPLSQFENFKSHFIECIDYTDLENDKKVVIKAKLDNKWMDIFWNLEKQNLKSTRNEDERKTILKSVDDKYLNFFQNITAFFSKDFNKVDIFKFEYQKEFIKQIVITLDCLISYQDYLYLINEIRDDLNIFENLLKIPKDISYAERLKFYVLMMFFLNKGLPNDNQNIFKNWMRVNINIINNTSYDNINDFYNGIKFINNISKNIENLYKFISQNFTTDKISNQLKEEIIKADLIIKNNTIEEEFIEAEKHLYLDGEIKFLIDYAKVEQKFNLEKFKLYRQHFEKLWRVATEDKDNRTLLHRALLTFGKYLPKQKNSNKYTFGSFGKSLREKNENWRRIFKSKEFKQLIDKLNYINIKQELQEIINNFSFDCNNWKSYFINPNKDWTPISYANNYQIRIDNKKQIFLNNGYSSSGATGWGWSRVYEMYSIYLLQYLERELTDVKITPHASSDLKELYPHISITDLPIKEWNCRIDIFYDTKKECFMVEFFEKNNNLISKQIINILKANNFQKDNKTYNIKIYKNFEFNICKQKELIKFLKKLFAKFQEDSNHDPI